MGMAAVFAGQVPACAVRHQSVQAVTTCRLWRVDCRALMERLEEVPALRLLLLKKYRRVRRRRRGRATCVCLFCGELGGAAYFWGRMRARSTLVQDSHGPPKSLGVPCLLC